MEAGRRGGTSRAILPPRLLASSIPLAAPSQPLRPQNAAGTRGVAAPVSPASADAAGAGEEGGARPQSLDSNPPRAAGLGDQRGALHTPGRPLSLIRLFWRKASNSSSPPPFSKARENGLHRPGAADCRARAEIYTKSPGGTRLRPFSVFFFFFLFLVACGEGGVLLVCVFLPQIFPGQ